MPAPSRAADLVQAILIEQSLTVEQALALIDTVLALEVDVLAYCGHRFGLGEAVVFERAAAWAGLAFYSDVPRKLVALDAFARIDNLGEIRKLRARIFDRDVFLWAPLFEEFLRLHTWLDRVTDARRRVCVVPPAAIVAALAEASRELLLTESRQRLTRAWPFATAHLDLGFGARLVFALGAVAMALSAMTPFNLSLIFLPASVALLLAPAVMRLMAVMSRNGPQKTEPLVLGDDELPVYTVLIPLRDEAGMVPMLARAMLALDYPPEKLDIKFVVEAGSLDTIAAVKRVLRAGPFGLIAVPDCLPRTKPKALNYALPFARGEFIVVYDAEDIPDPKQLRLAAGHFAADAEVACLQAALVIDNADENALTALYASEYAGLFGVMLPALARWNLPMPLGGTSNHFRVRDLKAVGSWDAFNVTEDADLGIRLARLRKKSAILASETREEAPVKLSGWMKQRTRWMKGWMQTFIVHNRNPRQFLKDTGWKSFLTFELYIGGLILAPLLHTLFVITAIVRLLVPGFAPEDGGAMGAFSTLVMATGYFAAVAIVFRGLWQRGEKRLLGHQILLPLYWLLHSIATAKALVELIHKPYFWAKTTHGQTSVARETGTANKPRLQLQASTENNLRRPYTYLKE